MKRTFCYVFILSIILWTGSYSMVAEIICSFIHASTQHISNKNSFQQFFIFNWSAEPLQLKIKNCWKLFLFEMCCVLAWMNEYIVQIISATRLWLISRYSHYTLKKRREMTAQNGHPCTEWFSNHKHMEKQSLICTRKTSFYMDNITSTLTIVVFSINWSRMFALYVRQMCCKLELKTLNNRKTTASLWNHRKRRVCSDPCICTTQLYSFFSAKFCMKSEEYFTDRLILL